MPINPTSYNVMFIDEAALKAQSIINENVDMKMLTPTIKLVQEIYLTRLLGTPLYVDLQNKILANSLNTNESFLLNAYVQPIMVWGIMKESPVVLSYKYMNKGVMQQESDNSVVPSLGDLQALSDWASQRFDWYSQRMINYLQANYNLFPVYLRVEKLDDTPPTGRGYRTRLALGGDAPYGSWGDGGCVGCWDGFRTSWLGHR